MATIISNVGTWFTTTEEIANRLVEEEKIEPCYEEFFHGVSVFHFPVYHPVKIGPEVYDRTIRDWLSEGESITDFLGTPGKLDHEDPTAKWDARDVV
jgi:hypothetical protein